MGVKADEHRESNGTRVESTGDVRTRLGVKPGLRDTTEWTMVNPVSSVRSWR